MTAHDGPPLKTAAEAVALLTVRCGEVDVEGLRQALLGITDDVSAWPPLLWMADVLIMLLEDVAADVPDAIRILGEVA